MRIQFSRAVPSVLSMAFTLTVAAIEPMDGPVLYHGPLEKQFAQIEKDVPGFAGWYFDEQGNAVVRVKDMTRAPDAIERVGRIMDARVHAGRGSRGSYKGRPQVRARTALFSFMELASYRDALMRELPAGVHSIDVDERQNLVTFETRDATAIGGLRALAARLRIPQNAIDARVAPVAESRATLAEHHRPLRGGMGFRLVRQGSEGQCTIGVNGYWWMTGGPWGFITASHCTGVNWSNTSTIAYQPSSPTAVATEYYDPPTWTGTNSFGTACPHGYACRYSDTAFYAYTSTSTSGGGTIAETASWNSGGPAPNNNVIGFMNLGPNDFYPLADGEALDKMGASSGWTWGYVTGTCQNRASPHPSGTTTVLLICQERASIYSVGGDSGAPIFKWYPTHVEFAGILWGGPSTSVEVSYFSSSFSVAMDMMGVWRESNY